MGGNQSSKSEEGEKNWAGVRRVQTAEEEEERTRNGGRRRAGGGGEATGSGRQEPGARAGRKAERGWPGIGAGQGSGLAFLAEKGVGRRGDGTAGAGRSPLM